MNESCTHCRRWSEREVPSNGATRAIWLKGRRRQRLPAPWAKAGKNIFLVDAPACILSPKQGEREFRGSTWVCCGIEHAGAAVFRQTFTAPCALWVELVQPVSAPGLALCAIFHMYRSFIDGLVRKMRLLDLNTPLYCHIKRGSIRELAAQCRDRMSGSAAGGHDPRG